MRRIQRIQFIFGFGLFVIFLITGQYLKMVVKPMYLGEASQRMMARANHIYIFFISMVNLFGSLIETKSEMKWIKVCTVASRYILMIAGIIFVVAFFLHYEVELSHRKMPLVGVVLTLTGVTLMLPKAIKKTPEINGQ